MIERQFVGQNMKEYLIERYIASALTNVGLSHTKLVKTPAGIKIIIYASRPGLIVGRRGANIKELTQVMKTKFKLENPQIEIAEIENINLDPQIVAEKITSALERFGTQRFKGIAHRILSDVMGAGARGIEVVISGKIPSARAKRWRFYAGYLKKCGDIAVNKVKKAISSAKLKVGTVGVQVKIMPPDVELPDDIEIYDEVKFEEIAAAEKKAEEGREAEKASKKRKAKKEEAQEQGAKKAETGRNKKERAAKQALNKPKIGSSHSSEKPKIGIKTDIKNAELPEKKVAEENKEKPAAPEEEITGKKEELKAEENR